MILKRCLAKVKHDSVIRKIVELKEGFWGLLSRVGPAYTVTEERCARVDNVEDFDD